LSCIKKAKEKKDEMIQESMVVELLEKDDAIATRVLEFVAINLSVRLAYIINMLKPQKIIIDGGLKCKQDVFLSSLKKGVRTLVTNDIDQIEIKYVKADPLSIAKGAAGLGIRQLFIGG
jgi:predicted NBD/HSP70 family sugar kinase